ncbi:MAG: hypothetical protein ACREHG_04940 [Candidatus Saccharimonadales bacterium]
MLVIPYTPALLRPETARWGILNRAQFSNVSYGDTAYWSLLYSLWYRRQPSGDLFIVEHDIVPDDSVYESMQKCSHMWCTSPYQIRADGHQTRESLGFARFSIELQYTVPELLEVVGPSGAETQADALWSRLDGAITAALRKRGYGPHVHGESVHLHDYTDPRTPWVDPYGG